MDYLTRRLMGCGLLLIVGACIGVGMLIYEGVVSNMHAGYAAPFKPQMAAYYATPTNPAAPTGGAVKGKMIVLSWPTQDFDWDVSYELPADMKAGKPEEVGTIVWTAWQKNQVQPGYTDGTPAYVQEVDVTVIDHASRTLLRKQHFRGGEPPKEIQSSIEGVGSKPTQQVVDFLKSLPRAAPTPK